MVRVALVSDTHVPDQIRQLPSSLVERLHGANLILHAGDLVSPEVLESLQSVARVIAVHGNMDPPPVRRRLPRKQFLTLAGRKVGLIHGDQGPAVERQYLESGSGYDSPAMDLFFEYLRVEFPEADVVVFGHLHVPVVKARAGCLFVNPGPIAPNRGRSSFAMLELGGGRSEVEVIDL